MEATTAFFTLALSMFNIVSSVEFLEKPQSVTLDPFWTQFSLNCSVDVASPNGMDWTGEINGQEKMDLCWSVSSEVYNCTSRYSVERPNNTVMNLIVKRLHFPNSSVAGNYCCNPDNGQGIAACAYVTETGASQLPHTDITEANEATVTIPTSTVPSDSHSTLSSGAIAGIVLAVVFAVAAIVLVICICCCCCKRRRNHRGQAPEEELMA